MSRLVIKGGIPLHGSIPVHGAKNAVLPILAATILCDGVNVIHNCPNLKDVETTIEILRNLGSKVQRNGSSLTIDTRRVSGYKIPEQLMRKLRSSVIFLGAILGRKNKAKISTPGGCELGERPIDLHMSALKQLGCKIIEKKDYLHAQVKTLSGCDIVLRFPSVGATENIMLAACRAKGKTQIKNAAKEPEIEDLAGFLNAMGANIIGAGTDTITIHGVPALHGTSYSIMPDRIAAITYLCCAAATGGSINITQVNPDHLEPALIALAQCGCHIEVKEDTVFLSAPTTLQAPDKIETAPYPGFPTDAQSLFLALLALAEGTSTIEENIFKSRFRTAEELAKMGARIQVEGMRATVTGVPTLQGAQVTATDLRGGAAMVIAALAASGHTEIENVCYIDRGYDQLEANLRTLGAQIQRV